MVGSGTPGIKDMAQTLRSFLQSEEHPNRARIVICGSSSRAILKKTDKNRNSKYYCCDDFPASTSSTDDPAEGRRSEG